MRNYALETEKRIDFIRQMLISSGAKGIVFGNSGGKDCALVGILCKAACANTIGLIMPGASNRNYGGDSDDARLVAGQFGIETRTIDLGETIGAMKSALGEATQLNAAAVTNLAPRLRMTALYAVSASENLLVAGTGNRSERYMGYFTKWGDGACDFNPIADLTVTEIFEFLEHLGAPSEIIGKAPSAGLYEGQTDESDMGISYASIDRFLMTGVAEPRDLEILNRYHRASGHKRTFPPEYSDDTEITKT